MPTPERAFDMTSTALLGRKMGMTRYFRPDGTNIPVTVISVGPCVVTQVKTTETDGYCAVQIGFEDAPARRVPMPQIGHDAKAGTSPKRAHREFRVADDAAAQSFQPGQSLTASVLEGTKFVDVVGRSKGKGFQGVMKRHRFCGGDASHGCERKHRSPGSIGGLCSNRGFGGGLKKGKRMAGHMGDVRSTARSLDLVSVDGEKNIIIVKGAVPGPTGGMVWIEPAKRLYRRKARIAAGTGE